MRIWHIISPRDKIGNPVRKEIAAVPGAQRFDRPVSRSLVNFGKGVGKPAFTAFSSWGQEVGSLHNAPYRLLLQRIRSIRREADVTQAELAKKLGTDQSYVSKYERGERRLDVVELRSICVALGIDFVDFLSAFETELQKRGLE